MAAAENGRFHPIPRPGRTEVSQTTAWESREMCRVCTGQKISPTIIYLCMTPDGCLQVGLKEVGDFERNFRPFISAMEGTRGDILSALCRYTSKINSPVGPSRVGQESSVARQRLILKTHHFWAGAEYVIKTACVQPTARLRFTQPFQVAARHSNGVFPGLFGSSPSAFILSFRATVVNLALKPQSKTAMQSQHKTGFAGRE
jgi:hypothetical protein